MPLLGNDDSLLSSNQFSDEVLKESETESKGTREEERDPTIRVRVSSPLNAATPGTHSALAHRCARNSSCSNSSSSSSTSSTDPSSDVVTPQPVSTAISVAMATFEKPRIWSLADMATSGTLSQSSVSVPTDFRSLLPPNNHVITTSPVNCSYQPWTSAVTRTLPVRDDVVVSDRWRQDTENDVIGVASGNRIFPGSTAETDWESNDFRQSQCQ